MQLSERTCKIAIEKSIINAYELILDAQILEQNKRVSRAFTLYHLSLEEVSKASYCISVLSEGSFNDKSKIGELKKLFKDHVFKLQKSSAIDLLWVQLDMDKNPNQARKKMEELINYYNHVPDFDKLKNRSLYTSYFDNSFSNPEDFFTENHVLLVKIYSQRRLAIVKGLWEIIKENLSEITNYNKTVLKPDPEKVVSDFLTELGYT